MSAPVIPSQKRPDPWQGLDPKAVVGLLEVRGWPVRASSDGVSLNLSPDGFALLVLSGREGIAAWKAVCAAHPEGKIRGPAWRDDGCLYRVVRSAPDLPTCDLVAGVRVITEGSVAIPPSVSTGVQTQWSADSHAANVEAAQLPQWVADIATNPDARALAGTLAARAALAETTTAAAPPLDVARPNADGRPSIVVQRKLDRLTERTPVPELARAGLDALASTPWGSRLFVLEGSNPPTMVCVLPPGVADDGSPDSAPRARVVTVSKAMLRGWLSGAARWVTDGAGRSGRETHEADPPEPVVTYALESCEGLRSLRGVVDSPVMRQDGSVITEPGYDVATRLYASFDAEAARQALDAIPARPTQADAKAAASRILSLVCDFPFESPAHSSMWLAGYLTMLCREGFSGPAPMFFCRANERGTGKSLLAELPHIITTGERPSMIGWSGNDEEFEKVVTAEAIAGSSCIVIDNVTGMMRSATLDRILTSGKHRARILGGNTRFDGAMRAVWWASGNNVETSADMGRRTGPIELVAREERPDQRTGFKADEADGDTGTNALHRKAKRERWQHIADALTILRAWHCAGRPSKSLSAWGSFESWSRNVRGPIVFAGLADPADAREEFRDTASSESSQLRGLLAGWRAAVDARVLPPDGVTLARVVKALLSQDPEVTGGADLREALEAIGGESLDRWRGEHMRVAGKFLKANRRRVARVGGVSLVLETDGESGGSARWKVARQVSPSDGEGVKGVKGVCSPPYAERDIVMSPMYAPCSGGRDTPYTPHTPSPVDPPSDFLSESSDSFEFSDDPDDIERQAIREECRDA